MRACAAVGVVVTHVAFQTGHTGGVVGRLFGRFDLAVAVFFALSGFLLWRGHAAAARGLRPIPATGHYLRSRAGPHHARVPGRGRGDPDPAARRQGRPDRLAGQPVADPDLRAADADRGADPDVEPGRRGELLPGPACVRAAGAPGAGAGTDSRARRRRRVEPRLGADPVRHPGRGQLAELAARVPVLVRRGHAAGRTDRDPGRLATPAGQEANRDGRRRGRRVPGRGLAAGGPRRPDARHRAPVHRQGRDGRGAGGCTDRPAGAGRARHPAPVPGQCHDGDAGPMVLRVVHLAPGGAVDGVPHHRRVRVQRAHAGRAGADGGDRVRDRCGQLRAGRVALPSCPAALGVSPQQPRRAGSAVG